jgi:hypothetical protein
MDLIAAGYVHLKASTPSKRSVIVLSPPFSASMENEISHWRFGNTLKQGPRVIAVAGTGSFHKVWFMRMVNEEL